jgi:hypothetical protein
MRSFSGVLGVSLLGVYLAACGGDDGLDISTDQENVCSEVAKVACHNLYSCCSEGEIENFLGVQDPRSQSGCEQDVQRLCSRQIVRLDAAIEAGRVRFEAERMDGCLQALVAPSGTCASIEDTLPWAEACMNSAWVGVVPDGSQCLADAECQSEDSLCATNRTCTPRPTTGQPCGRGCATGLYCQTVSGTCQPQAGAGQACTTAAQCQSGLDCDLAALPSTCAPLRDSGQPCATSTICKSSVCLVGVCAGTSTSCTSDFTCGGVAGSCTGRVCAQNQPVADYCEGVLNVIGGILNPDQI